MKLNPDDATLPVTGGWLGYVVIALDRVTCRAEVATVGRIVEDRCSFGRDVVSGDMLNEFKKLVTVSVKEVVIVGSA